MKHLLWIVALLSTFAQAGDEKIAIYLDFEKAYMSNDASSFSPWLGNDGVGVPFYFSDLLDR